MGYGSSSSWFAEKAKMNFSFELTRLVRSSARSSKIYIANQLPLSSTEPTDSKPIHFIEYFKHIAKFQTGQRNVPVKDSLV